MLLSDQSKDITGTGGDLNNDNKASSLFFNQLNRDIWFLIKSLGDSVMNSVINNAGENRKADLLHNKLLF